MNGMNLISFKNEKMINLDNVSNIYVENNEIGKVIFNMNYSVKIFGDKVTPDYVYWNFKSAEELDYIKRTFLPKIEDWIKPVEEGQRYVNPTCVSSIGIDNAKNRVIFNLNYPVTHPKDNNKLTSDFVFFNFKNRDNFNQFINEGK
jgi:hypothetical protein